MCYTEIVLQEDTHTSEITTHLQAQLLTYLFLEWRPPNENEKRTYISILSHKNIF